MNDLLACVSIATAIAAVILLLWTVPAAVVALGGTAFLILGLVLLVRWLLGVWQRGGGG